MKSLKAQLKRLAVFVFFFFNSLGLPSPLLWTNFGSLFYWRVYLKKRVLWLYGLLALLFLIYVPIHLHHGVDLTAYFKSLLVYLFILFSIPAVHYFLQDQKEQFPFYFQQISIFSILLFMISLGLLFFDIDLLWKPHNFGNGKDIFFRFQALSYEPSYYAILMSPLMFYFLFKAIFDLSAKHLILLSCISLPVLATVSFGFLGVFFLSLIVGLVLSSIIHRYVLKKLGVVLLLLSIGLTVVMFKVDVLYNRVVSIVHWQDDSINGRTKEAFFLANEMVEVKSRWFGIGHGQIKILGEDYIRPFYKYEKENWPVVALPNAAAETLAVFGYLGLLLRLFIQGFIFLRFRIHYNLFNLCLFLFLFIYQFMGSFYMSGTEIAFWVLCCTPLFPEFNFDRLKSGQLSPQASRSCNQPRHGKRK